MTWKDAIYEPPRRSGDYLASIRKPYARGVLIINDCVHYDADAKKWFKCDPFLDNFEPKEEITDMIIGWIDDLGAYYGVVGVR